MSAPTRHDDAVRQPVQRVVWIVFLLVIGLVLAALQLDRESLRRPGLALIVPEAAQSFALPLIVQMDLNSGRAEPALDSARRLVELRPLPAENLSILAMAAANVGSADLAVRAIGLSTGRGWREPLAQAAAAQGALETGDAVSAARRVVALWSVGHRNPQVVDLLTKVTATEQGRAEVARWLVENHKALDGFLTWSSQNLPTTTGSMTIAEAISKGAHVECPKLAQAVHLMMERGDAVASRSMWKGDCAKSAAGPQDVNFHPKTRDAKALFGWEARNASDFIDNGHGGAISSPGRWSLSYENGRPGWTVVAVRVAALLPGTYAATLDVPDADVSGLPVQMRISCITGKGDSPTEFARILANEPSQFQIPGGGCAVQQFLIFAPRGHGEISAISIAQAV